MDDTTRRQPQTEKLPVQEFSRDEVVQALRERNAKVPAMVARNFGEDAVPVVSPVYLVDEDEVFVWRVRLACGCLSLASTTGEDPARLEGKSQQCFNCLTIYRAITGWRDRRLVCKTGIEWSEMDLPDVAAKVRGEERARWTAILECGHEKEVETDVDFDPATGPRLITEEGVQRAGAFYLKAIQEERDPAYRDHLQRMWDLGQPHPEPETSCLPCANAKHPVVAYWPDGWLKPRKKPAKPAKKAATKTPRQQRADLERRLRRVEAEAEALRATLRDTP